MVIMKNSKFFFWLIVFSMASFILYSVNNVLMPFIVSFIFAYFFVPVANRMETKFKLPRIYGSLIIITFIICLIVALWLVLGPLLFDQLKLFVLQIPRYKEYVVTQIIPVIGKYVGSIDQNYVSEVESSLNDIFSTIFQYTASFADHIWQSGMAFINIISMLVLVPFITFYAIKDWKRISVGITHAVPAENQKKYQMLIGRINTALSGFIRGQLNVCIILAIYYSVALTFADINFSVFLGITTGVLTFIPFVGFISGFIASALVAYFQSFALSKVLMVIAVFAGGGLIENILSPKIVGDKIGLHPIWLIFALLVGANIFGFIGMLFAVPCAAVLNVLIKFCFEFYYHSEIYLGEKKAKK